MRKLYVVGLGPGDSRLLTKEAREVLEAADVLCGYTAYVKLVQPLFPQKETYTTGMKGELERCRWALKTAQTRTVALICSGDAGIYGMASPVLELAAEYPPVDIIIVPGITAAVAGAALLGAPLGHDFCVISLSDLLTPWELIEKRLALAAAADFVLCLYNPASHHRPEGLRRACETLLQSKSPDTICGITRSIGRTGQAVQLCTLAELKDQPADMLATVFIGSSKTRRIAGKMVTPRGYQR